MPEGPCEARAEEKRAAKELLDLRLGEVKGHSYTPDRQRPDFERVCELFHASEVKARKTTLDGYRELINCYLVKERHGAGDALARLIAQSGNKMETTGSETVSAA